MQKKPYKIPENKPTSVEESVVAYRRNIVEPPPSNNWNPNVPFRGTQEEWWEHFHRIEKGNFTPLEAANKEFKAWKKKKSKKRTLGTLKDKAEVMFSEQFSMTDEELINL